MITWVAVAKFLHVLAAIVWLGGVITLTLLNLRLSRTANRDALAALAGASEFYGRAVVGPAAVVTLLAGIATVLTSGFRFGALWITWGFAAILLSLLLGATLIRITTTRLQTAGAAGGANVPALQRRLMLLNGLNMLQRIPGVGALTAGDMLAEVSDIPPFDGAQAVAAYAGVAPRAQHSGRSVHKQPRLHTHGNRHVRKAFYVPAVTAVAWNPLVKAHAERLRAAEKGKMVARAAAMRKL